MHEKHHEHAHDSLEENETVVSEMEKLRKITEHWIGHNEEHARSYRLWADRARAAGREQAGRALDEIADATIAQNERFKSVLVLLGTGGEG